MKFVFLIGGACGFTAAALVGVFSDHTADRIVFDAAIGCMAGALLFRAFWAILLSGIRQSFLARRAAAVAAAKSNN